MQKPGREIYNVMYPSTCNLCKVLGNYFISMGDPPLLDFKHGASLYKVSGIRSTT